MNHSDRIYLNGACDVSGPICRRCADGTARTLAELSRQEGWRAVNHSGYPRGLDWNRVPLHETWTAGFLATIDEWADRFDMLDEVTR